MSELAVIHNSMIFHSIEKMSILLYIYRSFICSMDNEMNEFVERFNIGCFNSENCKASIFTLFNEPAFTDNRLGLG
jgi:hypothetical protein